MDPISIGLGLASRFAPGLVRRFAGDKAGDVAESLLGIGRRVTGLTDPDEVRMALEQNVAFQHEFQMQAAQLEVQLEQAYLADRQNARERDMAFLAAGKRNWRADILAVVVVLGLIANSVALLLIQDISAEALPLLNMIQGALIAGFMAVISFEFGSSRGSKEKTEALSRLGRG